MNLNDKILTTVIAGGISTVGFVLTYFTTRRKNKQEVDFFERRLSNSYVEKLYELRIKHYGKAFEITDLVGKKIDKTLGELPFCHDGVLRDIREWKRGEVNLVISEEALLSYYSFIKELQISKEAEGGYTNEQLDKMWKARTAFRVALRLDLGLLHSEEDLEL